MYPWSFVTILITFWKCNDLEKQYLVLSSAHSLGGLKGEGTWRSFNDQIPLGNPFFSAVLKPPPGASHH